MEALFWGAVGFIAYVYVGYPLVLAVWASAAKRRGVTCRACAAQDAKVDTGRRGRHLRWPVDRLPGVTIVIAARNEAARLPRRLENLLGCDYPRELLQIIVASDGSTDHTPEALTSFGDQVEVLQLPPRGKASALNAAVLRARHPILVFADARQRFARDAIRRLVTHFRDPHVGAVSGELMLDPATSTIGDAVGTYWRYEKWLRRHEAIVGSTLGVTGAIYAMRRWLWQPLPPDTLVDDVVGPMRVVMRGHRVIFDGQAQAFDVVEPDAPRELRRKTRTLAGNFQLLMQEPRVLVPGLNPVWLQFMSHKIGRLLVPYAIVAAFCASAHLAASSWFFTVVFFGQLTFCGLAVYGAALDRRSRDLTTVAASEVNREAA